MDIIERKIRPISDIILWRCRHETHVSTIKSETQKDPRFFDQVQNPLRSKDFGESQKGRQETIGSLVVSIERQKGFSYSKTHRIRKSTEFKHVIGQGQSIVSPLFVVLYQQNGLSYSRLGISIRRQYGKANQRNRLKRWIREVFRVEILPVLDGFDLVVIPRKKMSQQKDQIGFSEVKSAIVAMVEQFPKITHL